MRKLRSVVYKVNDSIQELLYAYDGCQVYTSKYNVKRGRLVDGA